VEWSGFYGQAVPIWPAQVGTDRLVVRVCAELTWSVGSRALIVRQREMAYGSGPC